MKFVNAELFMLKIMATLIILIAGQAYVKGIIIDITHFDLMFLLCLTFILLGQFYRTVRVHEPIAASLTVFALSLFFGKLVVTLTYMYLPYLFFGFDQKLANVDALFGFVWSDFVVSFADKPALVKFLALVYSSSYYQILLMILLFGVTARIKELHIFMLTCAIGLLISVSIWVLLPSSSPVGFQPIASDIAAKLNLSIPAATGAEFIRLAREGIAAFPPQRFEGMVGFPSFHTVMLVAIIYAARNLRFVFYPILLWNLAMFPAILLHGAHNLIDVFAGVAVAVFSIYCAKKINAADEPHARAQAAVPSEFETQHTN